MIYDQKKKKELTASPEAGAKNDMCSLYFLLHLLAVIHLKEVFLFIQTPYVLSLSLNAIMDCKYLNM